MPKSIHSKWKKKVWKEVTVISGSGITVLRWFGQMKSFAVSKENNSIKVSKKQTYTESHKRKEINIINIWCERGGSIVYMIFMMYRDKLPKEDTIVTLKIPMDN